MAQVRLSEVVLCQRHHVVVHRDHLLSIDKVNTHLCDSNHCDVAKLGGVSRAEHTSDIFVKPDYFDSSRVFEFVVVEFVVISPARVVQVVVVVVGDCLEVLHFSLRFGYLVLEGSLLHLD